MLRPKNSSATSIGFCAGNRQAFGGSVSPGIAQPATTNKNITRRAARRATLIRVARNDTKVLSLRGA
jgi:hypothetical protein